MCAGQPTYHAKAFADDGGGVLKQALGSETMKRVEAAYDWSCAHLSAALQDCAADSNERFIADTG